MKNLATAVVVLGICAGTLSLASANPTMRLSADGGLTWTNVEDNGPLDANSAVGVVEYLGPIGDWIVDIDTGFGSPLLGSPITPFMDLGTTTQSSQAANLIVQLSDTNFIAFPNETFIAQSGGFAGGTVTYTAYQDTGNVLFGSTATYAGGPAGTSPSPTASSLITLGPVTGNYQESNSVVVPNAIGTYSLTLETVIVHSTATHSDTDSSLTTLPPPPCNCTLTFNSPASITNCADDAIPDVTASEDCGNGPTPVQVSAAGAVTNGICPQIITRTNTATDDCGNVHTFVQTITVNCQPDCTITPSVTTAVVGGSNYTASVVSAGPGATYNWTVLNGTITAGQGTPQITWAAGTDTNSLISIVVTVTTEAGCSSTCSESVHLNPKPPEISLGSGDTATIGFWQNKNGQGLILNAANPPALGNWLGSNFPCLFGNLTGQPNSVVAKAFVTDFGVKGQKTYAQIFAGALASYFTSTDLGGGTGPAKFGFNQSTGGTGTHLFNVGSQGSVIGLQNNTSYPVMQILQAADAKCPFTANSAVGNALNTIFNAINTGGDIK